MNKDDQHKIFIKTKYKVNNNDEKWIYMIQL